MTTTPMTAVAPVRPVAPYVGGKRNLAKRLVALIETIPHRTYAEPFVGMGGVFLRRRFRPEAEVINDISRDIWTLYRVLQEHHVHFLEHLRFKIASRAEFERLCAVDPETLTDMQRAARFLYLQRMAFGGKVVGRNFGAGSHRPSRFDVTKVGPMLEDLQERLAGVVVERLAWSAFIDKYDSAETLFYLDPPYWGTEHFYGPGVFGRADFAQLAERLAGIKGRFILSINDTPETRAVFAQFHVEAAQTAYGLQGAGAAPAAELIVTGLT